MELTFSTNLVVVICFDISDNISFSKFSSFFALSTFNFLMPLISLDIFSSAIKSVFCAKNVSLCKHCKLTLLVGAEKVFEAIILSVLRSCTEFKSWILIADKGWFCFLLSASEDVFEFCSELRSGRGGGGGLKSEFSLLISSLLPMSSLSAVLLAGETEPRLSEMLRRYSDGLMRLLESPIPGNEGGTNGSTLCLLTKLGPVCFSESSPSKLIIVKSEHDEFSLLAAETEEENERFITRILLAVMI